MTRALTSYTRKISAAQAEVLKSCLEKGSFEFANVPYARFAAGRGSVKIVMYESGKLVVQGKGTQEFVEFTLEPEVLKSAELGYEEVLRPELKLPRLGVDESGKGDLFGPLCVAGVYVNEAIAREWRDGGVKDSKLIKSDRRIREVAEVISKTPGVVVSVVPIGNEAYNRLHAKMGNVNSILAWGHARVIENLLGQQHRMDPAPVRVVVDQFASRKAVVAQALMTDGKKIELVQRHKAEEDLAVAAASILARNTFLGRLKKLSEEYGLEFPKGAGAEANRVLKGFVESHDEESLQKVAKVHFRNIQSIRDL